MKINIERKVLAGLVIVVVLTAGIGLISSYSINRLIANARHASDSLNVRRRAQAILSTMLNLETGTRGYVITGEDVYLVPYRNAVDGIGQQMAELSQVIGDAPEQRQRFEKLANLVAVELTIEKRLVELCQKQDFEAASREVKTGDGKREMDRLREVVADIIADQDDLMFQQNQRGVQQARQTTWTIGIGGACGFLFVAALGLVIHKDLGRRREAAERIEVQAAALLRARDELEGRVQERTAELERTTRDLQVEAAERKQAGDALRKSEAKLQTIVENLGEGVVVSDLKGQVQHFNRAAVELHGYASLSECLRDFTEFTDTFELSGLDGTVWPVDQWPLARILRGEKLHDVEVRIRRINAEWQRIFRYGGTTVLDADGQPLMAIVTVSDITERKRAAEVIRQLNSELEQRVVERTAQLLTANNELEAFSYSVSHDLRAPLRSLDGFSQALLEDCSDKLDPEGQDNLRRIRGASQRMGHLIDDLLNLSRLTRVEMTRKTVDLSKIAQEVAEELRGGEPQRKSIFVIADGLVAQVDPQLLRIVLTNLFANAWKFTAKRPDARIEFGCVGENGSKAFFVRDNGVGFDMAYAGKLFGAFQRLHAMNDFPGTGIGLVTVQRIIHRHGGRIWAESAVEAGATFHFTL